MKNLPVTTSALVQKMLEAVKFDAEYWDFGPEITEGDPITIVYSFSNSEGCEVTISLYDTGNDEDDATKVYDAEIIVGNNDSSDPIYMGGALIVALQHFYDNGLDKRFGRLTGRWAAE